MKNLRYPLRIDGAGRAVFTTSTAQTYRDRVAVLLATMPGERPEDLDYGGRVNSALFESMDEVPTLVEEAVTNAVQRYLPEVSVLAVDTELDPTNDTRIVLTLTFSSPENEEETVSTILDLE